MKLTASRTRRLVAVVLAVTALAALLPAGASAAEPARARAVAPSAPVDTLWAATTSGLAACADPSSPSSLATCFAAGGIAGESTPVATDGVAFYSRDSEGGAWSCPVAGAGAGCSRVMGGGWGGAAPADSQVRAYAAADGSLWIGQDDGRIWRCPSDLPYQDLTSAPATCDLVLRALKGFGGDVVNALLLANTRLYVGLQSGRILRCDDPHVGSTCMTLDDTRGPAVLTLTVGAGALWAGRGDGVIWRCDPYLVDRCATWDTAGGSIKSTAYDGAGTLYAAVFSSNPDRGTIWSCPAATMNACTEVLADVQGNSVAAGGDVEEGGARVIRDRRARELLGAVVEGFLGSRPHAREDAARAGGDGVPLHIREHLGARVHRGGRARPDRAVEDFPSRPLG
ncbi:MAG: hypothetical protein ACKOTZ_05505, partial [Chloroflexota bacterium]